MMQPISSIKVLYIALIVENNNASHIYSWKNVDQSDYCCTSYVCLFLYICSINPCMCGGQIRQQTSHKVCGPSFQNSNQHPRELTNSIIGCVNQLKFNLALHPVEASAQCFM